METVTLENRNIVEKVCEVLARGGLVILPTETVYGAAVDATNEQAVRKLSQYKSRPWGKPFSVFVKDREMAEKYVSINEVAANLYTNFLPGPLTVISDGKDKVAWGIQSENGSLGIRISSYELVGKIVERFGKPITATSANASYKKRPYKIEDIWENLSGKQKQLVDLVVDAGELPKREPSTVIDTTGEKTVNLRLGDISWSEVKEITTRSEEATVNMGKELMQKYDKYLFDRAIIFALSGEMGAGKTQLAKGVARALGVKEEVVSPTYSIQEEYATDKIQDGKGIDFVHIDTWRLDQAVEELRLLGIKGRLASKSVIVVEWAERIEELLRSFDEEAVVVRVRIKYGDQENERRISWTE